MQRTILVVLIAFVLSACTMGKSVPLQGSKNRDVVRCESSTAFGKNADAEKKKLEECIKKYESQGYKQFDRGYPAPVGRGM